MLRHEVNVQDLDALLRSNAVLLTSIGEALIKGPEADSVEGFGALLMDQAEKYEAAANALCPKCRVKEVKEIIETK